MSIAVEPAATSRLPEGLRRFLERFSRQPLGVASAAYLCLLLLAIVLSEWITFHSPFKQDLMATLQSPSWSHWLGTDQFGRDNWSRLVDATRVTLLAPAIAVGLATAVGVPAGLVAGYFGGAVDWIVSRVNDALMSLPALILVVCLVGALGPGLVNSMIAVGIVYAPRLARVVRSATLAVREESFIEASRAIGAGPVRIMLVHVVPNILSPTIVQISLMMGFAILTEAGLSFIGLGVQPPEASWGVMIKQGFEYIYEKPSLIVAPGIAIAVTVLAFSFLGDAIRDSFGREAGRAR